MDKKDFEKTEVKDPARFKSEYIFLPKLHFKCEKETLSFSVIVSSSRSRYGVDFTIAYVLLQKNASKVQGHFNVSPYVFPTSRAGVYWH